MVLDFATHPDLPSPGRRPADDREARRQALPATGGRRSSCTVRETNLTAQYFYRAQGFRATEVAREHFGDTGEDAYLMQYLLDESVIEEPVSVDRVANPLEN